MSTVVRLGILGPVAAWTSGGARLTLPGPRHREVLARLVAAQGRVVPVAALAGDLWPDPPAGPAGGAVTALRTFVAALRRALKPDRAPRAPARVLVTDGAGYRIAAGRADVDAWQFEDRVRTAPDLAWPRRAEQLQAALAEFADRPWATGEAARLTELRLTAVELLAEARVRQGRAAEAVADLQAHRHDHPEREQAWLLLARALHADGRPEDALTLLRQGRLRLRDESGLDPTPRLADLEQVLLAADRAGRPDLAGLAGRSAGPGGQLWRESTAGMAGAGPRSLLTASAQLLGQLALTDAAGLTLAQARRAAAAEELDGEQDPELAAQLLTRVEVPGIWATADDPAQSAQVVAAARTVLDRLGPQASPALRARLLALIGIESRGTRGPAGPDAARQSEELARELGDPAVLMPALNARFLQSFHAVGRRQERAAVGAELIALSRRHDRSTYEILGHLVALQAAAAAGDVITADEHSAAADRLGTRHERDLVGVFTTWYRALRTVLTGQPRPDVEAAYESALATLAGCGMPGVSRGLEPLTRLCLRLRYDEPLSELAGADFGPNTPYIRPLLACVGGGADAAATAGLLRAAPAPPPDHLTELRWALLGEAARRSGDAGTARAVLRALTPAAGELIGAGTGMLSLGPATALLSGLDQLAARSPQ